MRDVCFSGAALRSKSIDFMLELLASTQSLNFDIQGDGTIMIYKNKRGSLKSFELHSPHKGGNHQKWHWQQNTWNPKEDAITGSSIHWTLFGRRF